VVSGGFGVGGGIRFNLAFVIDYRLLAVDNWRRTGACQRSVVREGAMSV
jgi:hypothetical protein